MCLKRCCGNDGSLLACKLISLDRNPGITPAGTGEVIMRILGLAVMTTFRRNVLQSAGDSQHCAGKFAGCEGAVDAVHASVNMIMTLQYW